MFFLRSAFWLMVMFVIMAPKDMDLGKEVDAASRQALALGQKAVVEHVLKDCDNVECAGGKAALAVLAAPPAKTEAASLVPLPRPRPDRMG